MSKEKMKPQNGKCPHGYHLVRDHFRNKRGESSMVLELDGVYIPDYCARNPKMR